MGIHDPSCRLEPVHRRPVYDQPTERSLSPERWGNLPRACGSLVDRTGSGPPGGQARALSTSALALWHLGWWGSHQGRFAETHVQGRGEVASWPVFLHVASLICDSSMTSTCFLDSCPIFAEHNVLPLPLRFLQRHSGSLRI